MYAQMLNPKNRYPLTKKKKKEQISHLYQSYADIMTKKKSYADILLRTFIN